MQLVLEGCSLCCIAFVGIVSSMSYWHAYHHWSGSIRGQRIVPVSEWYPQICLLFMAMPGWQNWLWSLVMQARSSMWISFHGWWSIMLRRSRWMRERITILWPSEDVVQLGQSQGSTCIWNRYQFRMLSRVAPRLVNPRNEQQLAQRHLYQLFLSLPSWNWNLWCLLDVGASVCLSLRLSMLEVRLYSDHP